MNQDLFYPILIIGSGVAGLSLALKLAEKGLPSTIITKKGLRDSASYWAQGGIACPISQEDSLKTHEEDTLSTGSGLSDPKQVHHLLKVSKTMIRWLESQGMPFTKNQKGDYHLAHEAGHKYPRILHANDYTGKALVDTLIKQVNKEKLITVYPYHQAIDFMIQNQQCRGALVYDKKNKKKLNFFAEYTAVATGGASALYLHTTNPPTSTGDGIAMAIRSNVSVKNLAFHQFHPTCLYQAKKKSSSILLSETLRGAGAKLTLRQGEAFLHQFDSRLELAPRDIISRAIWQTTQKKKPSLVYLDIRHKPALFIQKNFPMLYKNCLKQGYDMTKSILPVLPAAHYSCGGVLTDKKGRTSLKNLYAIGEVACTGLHGANRLASNSLLECLVTAYYVSEDISNHFSPSSLKALKYPYHKQHLPSTNVTLNHHKNNKLTSIQQDLKKMMWKKLGIIRNNQDLQAMLLTLNVLKKSLCKKSVMHNLNYLEIINHITIAEAMTLSAINLKENKGTHFNKDCKKNYSTIK